MLPVEIQKLIDEQLAVIGICDAELTKLQQAIDVLKQRRREAADTIAALRVKWTLPDLGVWPAEPIP